MYFLVINVYIFSIYILVYCSATSSERLKIHDTFNRLTEEEVMELQEICGNSIAPFEDTNKIYDSRHNLTAKVGQFPWMVQLELHGSCVCGAFLISKRHVLTAAHCFLGFKPQPLNPPHYHCKQIWKNSGPVTRDYRIRVGSLNNCKGGLSLKVVAYAIGDFSGTPEDGCNGAAGDIALLELRENIPDEMIEQNLALPVCLGNEDRKLATGQDELTVMGWGYDPFLGDSSPVLRYTTVTAPGHEQCTREPQYDQFCTTEMLADVCSGDSGGSIVQLKWGEFSKYEAMGLVSNGEFCDDLFYKVVKQKPGVIIESEKNGQVNGGLFTDLRKHMKWIVKYSGVGS